MSSAGVDEAELLEALPDAALLISGDGVVRVANRRARALLGIAAEDAGRVSLVDRIGGSDDELRRHLQTWSRTRDPTPSRLRLRDRNGNVTAHRCEGSLVRPWSPEASPLILLRIHDGDQPSARFLLVNRRLDDLQAEITRRRQAEARLQHSRRLLEEAERMAEVGSWEWDIENDAITWSDELYRLFGLKPGSQELSYDTYLDALPPVERERVDDIVETAYATREPFAFEHQVIWPRDEVRILNVRGRVQTDASGRPVRMVGMAQDVTRRRRAEATREALAELGLLLTRWRDEGSLAREATRLLTELLGDYCHLCTVDDAGARAEIAHRAGRGSPDHGSDVGGIVSRSLESLPGGPATALARVMESGEGEAVPKIDATRLEELAVADELDVLREIGARSALVLPLVGQGPPLGALAVVSATRRYTREDLVGVGELAERLALGMQNNRLYRKTHERAEEEEKLRRRAEREAALRDEMTALIGHDLRNPLHALNIAVSVLELDAPEARKAQQIEAIRRAATQMNRLIEDLLDANRIETGSLKVKPQPVAVRELLDDVRTIFEPQAGVKAQELAVELADEDLVVLADSDRILQVLSNLLTNAMRHTPRGGRIEISAAPSTTEGRDDRVEFTVADSGPGVDPDDLPRIFERFWQSQREERGSAGLGLPIARGIVEAHGGKLWLDTDVPRGATFRFTLEAARRQAA